MKIDKKTEKIGIILGITILLIGILFVSGTLQQMFTEQWITQPKTSTFNQASMSGCCYINSEFNYFDGNLNTRTGLRGTGTNDRQWYQVVYDVGFIDSSKNLVGVDIQARIDASGDYNLPNGINAEVKYFVWNWQTNRWDTIINVQGLSKVSVLKETFNVRIDSKYISNNEIRIRTEINSYKVDNRIEIYSNKLRLIYQSESEDLSNLVIDQKEIANVQPSSHTNTGAITVTLTAHKEGFINLVRTRSGFYGADSIRISIIQGGEILAEKTEALGFGKDISFSLTDYSKTIKPGSFTITWTPIGGGGQLTRPGSGISFNGNLFSFSNQFPSGASGAGYPAQHPRLDFTSVKIIQEIFIYRFENNRCNGIVILETNKQSNDYDILDKCNNQIIKDELPLPLPPEEQDPIIQPGLEPERNIIQIIIVWGILLVILVLSFLVIRNLRRKR